MDDIHNEIKKIKNDLVTIFEKLDTMEQNQVNIEHKSKINDSLESNRAKILGLVAKSIQ